MNSIYQPPRRIAPVVGWLCTFLFFTINGFAQPNDLPWDPDPDCNCMVTDGIAAVTCGTIQSLSPDMQFTFGLVDLNGALPATGRVDVTAQQAMYKHPSWLVNPLGNVFGITMDNAGNIYVGASSNYSSDFFTEESVIRYGDIGGGPEDLSAAGTIYRIGCTTPEPTVFAVLPQQAYSFTQTTCEGGSMLPRNTGPGLGNLVYSFQTGHIYASNFEDGRIYRLDTLGNILDSYDPLDYDDGTPGPPVLESLAYGLALDNENERLFFGTIGDEENGSSPSVYSIDLNPDGSFTGSIDNSVMPVGATWDNYVGMEQLHYTIDIFPGFFYVHFISDLQFTPNGELLIGKRMGCGSVIQSSYNHDGAAIMIDDDGTGIYSQYVGNIYTANGSFSTENAYGGVDYFDNPNGGLEFVFSSADILSEQGPHGIVTIEAYAFGSPINPAEPAGVIAYIPGTVSDIKGIGGDVYVFKDCNIEQSCPLQVATTDLTVCSGDLFDLTFNLQGGNLEVDVSWTDGEGNEIEPVGLSIDHTECGPGTYTYYLDANCVEDTTQVYADSVVVTVIPSDLTPYYSVIEEPCFVDFILETGCEDYLSVIGDIPTINPGDSGTVTLQLIQTTVPACDTLEIELNYNCSCSLIDLIVVEEDCEDGTFLVNLDFQQENSGNGFNVTDQSGDDLGSYLYADLPITLGPFSGDATSTYTLNIEDNLVPGCASTASFGPVYCSMSFQTTAQSPLCIDGLGSLEITNIVGGLAPYMYSVDGGATFSSSPIFFDLLPGTYDVVVQDATGAEVENVEVIFEPQDVLISLEAEVELELGDSYQINIQTNILPDEIGSVQWTPATGLSCTDCLNPIATPAESTVYTVLLTDENGCAAEAQIEFRVDPSGSVYIPNVFTPDGDGSNDVFMIFAKDGAVREIREFMIFSRWGESVYVGFNFKPNDPANGWDGTHRGEPMNPAVFAYYAIVEFIDGRTVLYEGDVTLIR
jgi:gliding motility-associated-like protein